MLRFMRGSRVDIWSLGRLKYNYSIIARYNINDVEEDR